MVSAMAGNSLAIRDDSGRRRLSRKIAAAVSGAATIAEHDEFASVLHARITIRVSRDQRSVELKCQQSTVP